MGWSAAAVFDGRRWHDWNPPDPDEHPVSPRSRPPYLSVNVYDSTVVALWWEPGCSRQAFVCGTWREEFGETEPATSPADCDRAAVELAHWLRTYNKTQGVPTTGLESVIRTFLVHDERPENDATFAEDDLPGFLVAIGIPLPTPDDVADFL